MLEGISMSEVSAELQRQVLSDDALRFLGELQRTFGPQRKALLNARRVRQETLSRGGSLDFLPQTREVREGNWKVAAPAAGLADRRCEITGPTDAKMLINALNSGARIFMCDFEDANAPTWDNLLQGQLNLSEAIDQRLTFSSPEGKHYALHDRTAVLIARPRGWHLVERHLRIDGESMSASLFDFGLYFLRNARRLLERGRGPYFYLPKMESHLEARLWNDVFLFAQKAIGLPSGTIRATVLVETLPAAFEMDEILFELREHSSGINAGRWDYIFSMIKTFRSRPAEFLLPDRAAVTMTVPFMRAYTELLVRTCHHRGAHAIGGMAAFIPNRKDEALNQKALAAVRADKEREANDGFDGSWVAHPDLVNVCTEVFDQVLGQRANQLERRRDEVQVTAAQLLDARATPGTPTQTGLRNNISVAIQYLESWLRGSGAVAINNLMEDTATSEIARAQVWQWVHAGAVLNDGTRVTSELVKTLAVEELARVKERIGSTAYDAGRFTQAQRLFEQVALAEPMIEFLTLPGYELLP